MPILARKILIFALLAAFAIQGTLIYSDGVAKGHPMLTELEGRGRQVFLAHNCYACHQIYGFGGFLGPDLTNVAQRLPRARLDELMTRGSLQMPAFHLPADDIDAIEAYLRAIDRTGVGVARHMVPPPMSVAVDAVCRQVAGAKGDGEVARGHQLFTTFCAACHVPLRANALGTAVAPDPCSIAARLSAHDIEEVLIHGRIARGMPPAPLSQDQRRDVIAFLTWLATCRDELVAECGTGTEQGLPWWEFR